MHEDPDRVNPMIHPVHTVAPVQAEHSVLQSLQDYVTALK